jgi:ankyrin repeat protein
MISFLMQEGADINLVSTHGYTLLMFASVNGHSEMVEYLLENGADPNQLDADQRSAMFLAAVQDQWHIIKIILEHGGQISPKTIAAEDKIPYLIGPMYEIGGEFYLETNNREKAMELLELAEQTFMGMSEEYSSRATGKAIQRHLRDFGMMLAVVGGSVAARYQGKIEARQQAQTSALSKSKSLGEYSRRLSATQPI